MTGLAKLLAGAALASAFLVGAATANAFVAWKVEGVPWGDALNARRYPSNISQKRAAYPNGTQLSMTGRCTGGVNLREIEGAPVWKQKQAVRGEWCEIWHDPQQSGNFESGWVYGRFITPAQ